MLGQVPQVPRPALYLYPIHISRMLNELFVTLARRSNVETLTLAFIIVLFT